MVIVPPACTGNVGRNNGRDSIVVESASRCVYHSSAAALVVFWGLLMVTPVLLYQYQLSFTSFCILYESMMNVGIGMMNNQCSSLTTRLLVVNELLQVNLPCYVLSKEL